MPMRSSAGWKTCPWDCFCQRARRGGAADRLPNAAGFM
jgi:hypothetical protein